MAALAIVTSTGYAATSTVGTAPGQFSVSPTGAATYQIPLAVPPGTNGLKPDLALLYNSQAGDGLLGMGWSLSGLSVISRCPQTIDQDGAVHLPNLTGADRFCLDGQRLMVVSGNYGAANSVYRTEIDSFQQVTAKGAAGTGPASFTVVDRAGLTKNYSTTVIGGDGSSALIWLVTQISDRYGNYIKFHYNITAADPPYFGARDAISSINYGNASGDTGIVSFTYDYGGSAQFRSDEYTQYVADTLVEANAAPLTQITVEDGSGNVLRTYNLDYNYTQAGTASGPGPATLVSLKECASDGPCHPATTFAYSGLATNASSFASGTPYYPDDADLTQSEYQVADLDGDGLPDYLYVFNNALYVTFGANFNSAYNLTTEQYVKLTSSSTPGIGFVGGVVASLNGDGTQQMLVPYFAHPTASPDTPTWDMIALKNGVPTLEPVPTQDGQPLLGCYANDEGCPVDAIAIDLDGKGQDSLVFASGGQLFYYQNRDGKLSSVAEPTGISYSGSAPAMTRVNYSGTGLPEFYVAGTGVVQWVEGVGFNLAASGNLNDSNSKVMFIDADGGGLSAPVMITGSTWTYYPNTGRGFSLYSVSNSYNMNYATAPSGVQVGNAQLIDWYRDGRQEVIVPVQGGNWQLFEPTPTGCYFVDTGVKVQGDATQPALFIDINGDGQPDLLYSAATQNSQPYVTELSLNSASPFLLKQVTDGLGHSTYIGYEPLDSSEQGVYAAQPGKSPIPRTFVSTAPQQTRPYMGSMYVVDAFGVDAGISNSSGPEQLFTYYLYAGSTVDQWGRGFLGFAEVEAINHNSGLYTHNTYIQNFPYTGQVQTSTKTWDSAISNLSSFSIGPGGIVISCTNFMNQSPGRPSCAGTSGWPTDYATQFADAGVTVSVTNNCYANAYDTTTACGGYVGTSEYGGVVYAPFSYESTTKLYDIGTGDNYETSTTTTVDTVQSDTATFGVDVMPSDVKVTTVDNTPNNSTDVATIDTTSAYADEATCPGHTTSVTVTHTFPKYTSYPSQTETFGYDNHCFVTSDQKTIVGPPGSTLSLTLTKTYTPDAYGNPLTTTVSGTDITGLPTDSGVIGRETKIAYDVTNRFPTSITNALNQTENLSYDSWGSKLTDTDANGNIVTYRYDGFERKTRQSGPQPGVFTKWTYAAGTTAYQITQTGSDGSSTTTQYDDFSRVIQSSRLGLGGETVNQYTQYDLMGRVVLASAPTKNTHVCWDRKNYDVLNRVTTEYQPLNSSQCDTSGSAGPQSGEREITNTYSDFTTTHTVTAPAGAGSPGSEQTATTLNALGKQASVTDQGGTNNSEVTTSYSYDPWGNLTSVTPPDNGPTNNTIVSMTYDSAGDKLAMQDPDMGSWSYSYDASGELLSQTDAKGQIVNNTYDVLGRLVKRDEPEGETRWIYDVAYGAGVGRLGYTVGPNGVWEGYAYDVYGETTDKITVTGGHEYWITDTYDDQGRVSQVVYPDLTAISATAKPAVPAGLGVAVDPDNGAIFDLNWTLTKDGEIYHVYRTPSTATQPTDADEIYSGPVPNWPDSTISTDGTYTWWLAACNDTNCSIPYATISANVILPPTVAGAPQPLMDSHQRNVTLTWAGSSPRGGTTGPITYNVFYVFTPYGGSTPGPSTEIAVGVADSGSGTTSTTVSLSQDGTYQFTVRACQGQNNACAAASDPMNYTTVLAPSIPQQFTVPATIQSHTQSTSVPLSWTAPSFAGEPINQVVYEVQSEDTLVPGSVFADIPNQPNTNLTAAQDVTLDGKYLYEVRACDSNEAGVCSAYVQAGPVPVTLAPTSPGAPLPPGADLHTSMWTVSWDPSTMGSIGSNGSISYDLQQSLNGGSFASVNQPVSAGTNGYLGQEVETAISVYSGGYDQDGTYTYQLAACNNDPATGGTACTNYVPGAAAYATTITPGSPNSISVPTVSNSDGTVPVSFSAPAAGTGGTVAKYVVQLGLNDPESGTMDWSYGGCSVNFPGASCTIALNMSHVGETFHVQALAVTGGVQSAGKVASNNVTIRLGAPAAPSLSASPKTVTVGQHTVLSWTNNGGIISSYTLQKEGSTGVFNTVYSGSATTYTSPNFSVAGDDYYRVQACNASACSGWSNTVDVIVTSSGGGGCGTCLLTPAPGGGTTVAPTGTTRSSASAATGTGTVIAAASLHGLTAVSNLWVPLDSSIRVTADIDSASTRAVVPVVASARPVGHWLLPIRTVPSDFPTTRVARVDQRREKVGRDAAIQVMPVSGPMGSRQVYFLAHAGRSTQPARSALHLRSKLAELVRARFAPSLDPRLSLYPPLRRDPRVQAHFQAQGGYATATVREITASQIDCDGNDGDDNCSEPTGSTALMVGYVYNTVGYLVEVQKLDANGNPAQTLWLATDETAQGQVDQQYFDLPTTSTDGTGSAFSVADNYDAASGLLGSTTATANGTTGGQSVLTAGYTWDGFNNLLNRNMGEAVPAGQTGASNLNENFAYDAVNRLCDASSASAGCSASSMMQYQNTGSFTSNGTYTNYQYGDANNNACNYPTGSTQPHAVAQMAANGTTRGFCYDLNGNLVSESGDVSRTIGWTSYNKPSQITSNGSTANFTYGPSRERVMTSVMSATGTVTTTYIDGLFEQVTDSATGNITYRHYILAGGTRIGEETVQANSGGQQTADTLNFFVHDEVGSVIAAAQENMGGLNQTFNVYSHDAWGKGRTTSGTSPYATMPAGSYLPDSAVMAGQQEGFGGHEDADDLGIVDMEGRIYDPEVGRFLSPDPNVQFPDSSQGYNRYTYVGDNPVSLSDPSGYFISFQTAMTLSAAITVDAACEGTCAPLTAAFLSGAAGGFVGSGGNLRQGLISGGEAMAFSYAGGQFGPDPEGAAFLERSVTEGLIGGTFSAAGGGRFGDGFVGAFVGSELSGLIGEIGGSPTDRDYYDLAYEAARVAVASIVGGTTSELSGGRFSDGAVAAAMQRLYNDDGPESRRQGDDGDCNDSPCTLVKLRDGSTVRVPTVIAADVLLADQQGTTYGKNVAPCTSTNCAFIKGASTTAVGASMFFGVGEMAALGFGAEEAATAYGIWSTRAAAAGFLLNPTIENAVNVLVPPVFRVFEPEFQIMLGGTHIGVSFLNLITPDRDGP